MTPLHKIESIDEYISAFAGELGQRVIEILQPLHTPGISPLPSFDLLGHLFPAQQHAVAALVQMLNERGSGFFCGEMGVGKTASGAAAIHTHAGGKPYRALVLCPDHLIDKWCRELMNWIPHASIIRFGPGDNGTGKISPTRQALRDTLELTERFSAGSYVKVLSNGVRQERKCRAKPAGNEWVVLGKNQVKYASEWLGLTDIDSSLTQRPIIGWALKSDEPVYCCPRCGSVVADKDGDPVDAKKLSKKSTKKFCEAILLKAQPNATRPDLPGGQWIVKPTGLGTCRDGDLVPLYGRTWVAYKCREALYTYTAKPYRWAPANLIQRKMRQSFKYMIMDESHEHKSADAQQAVASSKLIGSVRYVLALTGTLIGGYASHLFPIMMRIAPESLKEDGFQWQSITDFSRKCGRVDTHKTTTIYPVKGRDKKPRKLETSKVVLAPGVMPSVYTRHLLGASVFLGLEELHDALPKLYEYAGGPLEEPASPGLRAGYYDTAVTMNAEQRDAVRAVTMACRDANAELLRTGNRSFLGVATHVCLGYPDMPFGWKHRDDLVDSWQEDGGDGTPDHLEVIGYYDTRGGAERSHENWIGVIDPPELSYDKIYPKEKALIDICMQQHAEGRQTWVYVTMTGKQDIQPRLQSLLEAKGLRVGILRANTVQPINREAWIEENGMSYDVIISNAELVKTGLDLFSAKPHRHNYSTLIFYQTGYNQFTMRQASRRAWRVGQTLDCRVFYLYYKHTAQEVVMKLMSRKMLASMSLEGNFDSEGLAALAGDNMQLEIMRALAEGVEDETVQRDWERHKAG